MAVLGVLFWSQLAGLTLVLALVAIGGISLEGDSVPWGIAAGVVGSIALGLFYAGLAAGAMSLVAPLSA